MTVTRAERAVFDRTGRVPRRRQELPPLDPKTTPKPIIERASKFDDLQRREREATEVLRLARERVEPAAKADLAAHAAAIRAGKPAPPRTAEEDARAALEKAERNSAAMTLATEGALDDLLMALEEHGEEWRGTLANKRAAGVEAAQAARDALVSSVADVESTLALERWIKGGGPRGKAYRPIALSVAGIAATNGEPYRADAMLAEIGATLEELVRPPAVERQSYLQPTDGEMEGASA